LKPSKNFLRRKSFGLAGGKIAYLMFPPSLFPPTSHDGIDQSSRCFFDLSLHWNQPSALHSRSPQLPDGAVHSSPSPCVIPSSLGVRCLFIWSFPVLWSCIYCSFCFLFCTFFSFHQIVLSIYFFLFFFLVPYIECVPSPDNHLVFVSILCCSVLVSPLPLVFFDTPPILSTLPSPLFVIVLLGLQDFSGKA